MEVYLTAFNAVNPGLVETEETRSSGNVEGEFRHLL
jgi:hypothetical protein